MAQEFLKRNPINRRISPKQVKYYAQQMLKGDWCSDTDESIKISINRNLLDGQHRLMAVVSADMAVKMRITYNLPDDVFRYIDQGKKRSAQDVLHIAGVPNSSLIAGIIKSHNILSRGNVGTRASQAEAALSNEDIFIIYQQRPEYWQDTIARVQRWYKSFHKIINPSFIGAHYTLFQDLHVDQARTFFEKVCTGIGLNKQNEPCKLLRDYFLRQLDLKGKKANSMQYTSALVIKAWNLFRQSKEVSYLKWDSSREDFPSPI